MRSYSLKSHSDTNSDINSETDSDFYSDSYSLSCSDSDNYTCDDTQYMRRAIELAKRGEGWVHPNPLVGAVIVKEGRIIGEGYHERCGELHAERNALLSLKESAEGATLYVTLEPCCHYGRTPPCTVAIIENKLSKVVIGSRDPNPKVSGQGAAILRQNGIEVCEDFLREECDSLNPVFFHYITTRTPYVIMKYAMTADGKIATKTGASKWITGKKARRKVHEMRHACMGIMAGIGTVLQDDPMLNCRIEGGRDPVRIVLDSNLRIPIDSQICQSADRIETIVVCGEDNFIDIDTASGFTNGTLMSGGIRSGFEGEGAEKRKRAEFLRNMGVKLICIPVEDGRLDLKALMKILGEREIDSILLEGGGTLNESALKAGIVREICVFIAPKIFGGKGKAPVEGIGVEIPDEAFKLEYQGTELFGEDLMLRYTIKEFLS